MQLAGVAVATALFASPAFGGTAVIDGLGGSISIDSRDMSGSIFGVGSPVFSNAALSAIHTSLAGDGVTTDGFVTFLLAQTDAGLAFIGLVDDENAGAGFSAFNAALGLTTTGDNALMEFINDSAGDILGSLSGSNQTFGGDFTWDSINKGDGFGWAGLVKGDFLTFAFASVSGVASPDGPVSTSGAGFGATPFQFATFTGGSWSLLPDTRGFSSNDQFSFSVTIIPLPTGAGLASLGLLGMAGLRRRRLI